MPEAAGIDIRRAGHVSPEARRRGIGAALLAKASEFAASEGAVRLTLSTEHTNTTAQALYESQGWIREPNFRNYTLTISR